MIHHPFSASVIMITALERSANGLNGILVSERKQLIDFRSWCRMSSEQKVSRIRPFVLLSFPVFVTARRSCLR